MIFPIFALKKITKTRHSMAKQISKYLLANERDALWGLTVSTVGYEEIQPGDDYPTRVMPTATTLILTGGAN